VCTEAGMSAIRAERDYVIHEDFMKVCSLFRKQFFPCIDLSTKTLPYCISFTLEPGCKKIERGKET